MSGRLVAHLGMALCWFSLAVACNSAGPPNSTGSESRETTGGSNGSAAGGSSGGSSETSGSSGGLTGGRETGGGSSGGRVGCQSACNLSGQYCDDAGLCVSCLADQECSAKSSVQPYCYVDAGANYGTCVECLGSSQCKLGEVCSPQLLCVPGCGGTSACTGQTPICEGDSGMCVTCLSAAECSGGLVCEQGLCVECSGTMANFECYQNYKDQFLWVCSPENNCVQCIMDDDCPEGEHCVGTGCQ